MTSERTLPNFIAIADTITDRMELAEVLERLYNQGYYAGKIDGKNNWYEDYDKEVSYGLCPPGSYIHGEEEHD